MSQLLKPPLHAHQTHGIAQWLPGLAVESKKPVPKLYSIYFGAVDLKKIWVIIVQILECFIKHADAKYINIK